MRPLRYLLVVVVLLQLARAESDAKVDGLARDGELSALEDVPEEQPQERKLSPIERHAIEEELRWQRDREEWDQRERAALRDADANGGTPQENEEAEYQQRLDEEMETTEEPAERKLTPRERQIIEEELRWQRDMEEWDRREREAALQDSESTKDTTEEVEAEPDYPQEQNKQEVEKNHPAIEDDDDGYPEMQRRLEVSGDDEEEAEAVPVIPGLTDVELFAFNAEFANEEVLDKIIDWSYDQVALMSRYRDNYIHVEDLYQFLLKTLNPLDEEIDQEDEQILTDAVTELRKQQGLVDEEQIVYRGFIARGMPLRFLQSLAHEMHQTVQTRRLQSGGRDEL